MRSDWAKDEEEGREREGGGEAAKRRSRSNKVCQSSAAFHVLFFSFVPL